MSEQAKEKTPPTFKEVLEKLYDPKEHLREVKDISQVPSHIIPDILITNLESWMQAKDVKLALDQILALSKYGGVKEPTKVRTYVDQARPEKCGLVSYESRAKAESIFNQLTTNPICLELLMNTK